MFFEKTYKPIPLLYNLELAMLWRHPQNVELDKVKGSFTPVLPKSLERPDQSLYSNNMNHRDMYNPRFKKY